MERDSNGPIVEQFLKADEMRGIVGKEKRRQRVPELGGVEAGASPLETIHHPVGDAAGGRVQGTKCCRIGFEPLIDWRVGIPGNSEGLRWGLGRLRRLH